MSKEDLDSLLERMPKIAEAVNAFSSEAVQHDAFRAMLAAFAGTSPDHVIKVQRNAEGPAKPAELDAEPEESDDKGKKTAIKRKRSPGKASWTVNKNLDLHPQGKDSFEKFLGEKAPLSPLSDQDMIATIVYYLSEVLELPKVTIDDVGTVFRRTPGRKEPTNLPGVLYNAQGRKTTIDCSDMQDIKLTSAGRNFVDHSLPVKAKTKK